MDSPPHLPTTPTTYLSAHLLCLGNRWHNENHKNSALFETGLALTEVKGSFATDFNRRMIMAFVRILVNSNMLPAQKNTANVSVSLPLPFLSCFAFPDSLSHCITFSTSLTQFSFSARHSPSFLYLPISAPLSFHQAARLYFGRFNSCHTTPISRGKISGFGGIV